MGTRPVGLIGPEYNPDRVFGGVEFPGYLNDPNPRGPLLGLPQSTWQGLYNDLKAQHGESGALSALHDLVKAGANAQQANLEVGKNPDGSLSFAAKPEFMPDSGFAGTSLPSNAASQGNLWTLLNGGDYHGGGVPINSNDIDALAAFGEQLKKFPGLLDKLGVAGDLLGLGLAIGAAAGLLDKGDVDGALKAIGDWALDFAGGSAGGLAGVTAALALVPLLGLAPAGLAAGTLTLALGLAGGFAGSKLALTIADAALSYNKDYVTPIVVDLNKNGFYMSTLEDGVWFDIDNDGFTEKTAFPIDGDAILVRDLNGNGLIDNQNEMFGDNTSQIIVPNATNALGKMQALDTNGDKIINKLDAGFATLRLWVDKNHNGISESREMFGLAALGIGGFKLNVTPSGSANYDINGSTLVWSADWLKTNGTVGGQYGDINFAVNQTNSWFIGNKLGTVPVLKPDVLFLPVSRGYGEIKSLPIAASENLTLYNKLKAFDAMSLSGMAQASNKLADLVYTWAGVSAVTPESGSIYYNAKMISFMEKFFGSDFEVLSGGVKVSDYPTTEAPTFQLSDSFGLVWTTIKSQLMVQGPLKAIYSNSYYDAIAGQIVINDDYDDILARAKALMPKTGITPAQFWQEVALPLVVDARNHGGDTENLIAQISGVAGFQVPVIEAWFTGQTRGENYRASFLNDYIDGGAGNDTLQGMEGNDSILGGDGADSLEGSEGNDTLYGGAGNDNVTGDHIYAIGNDVVYGGTGNDTLYGGQGADLLYGEAGRDVIYAGMDSDTIEGDINSADNIFGGAGGNDGDYIVYSDATTGLRINLQAYSNISGFGMGGDTLSDIEHVIGTKYADSIVGNGEGNYLYGGAGSDTLYGGAGSDTLDGGHVGIDELDGGDGFDWVVFSDARLIRGVEFWMNDRYQSDILIHGTTRNIEGVVGSNNADTLFGDTGNNILMGKGGADYIFASAGNDTINPGIPGNDTISGEAGIDQLNYQDVTSGVSVTLRPDPFAPIQLIDSIEQIFGSNYLDNLTGHTGNETIWGANGNDIIDGAAGNDRLDGGAGNDVITGSTGNDYLIGGTGADKFRYIGSGQGADTIADFSTLQGDKIVLKTGTAYSWTDLGTDIKITNGTNIITLVGVNDFSATMIEFAAA